MMGKAEDDIKDFKARLPKDALDLQSEGLQKLLDEREVELRITAIVDIFIKESVRTWKVNKQFLVQKKPGIGHEELIYVYSIKQIYPFFLHRGFRIDISRSVWNRTDIVSALTPGRSGDHRGIEGIDELIKCLSSVLKIQLSEEKKTIMEKLGIYVENPFK